MKNQEVLVIKNKSEVLYLQLDDILYIQADRNYSNIILADGGVINTLTYQRAEIARMMEEQLPNSCKQFVLLGRSYMVNTGYVLRIQPSKQLLTFCVNRFGTTKKVSIKATAKALAELAEKINSIPIPQGSLLFWSEFAEASIEYRYNYLFTHKSHAGTSAEAHASVQGAKIRRN